MGNGKEKEIKMPGWRGTEAPLAYLFHYKSSRLFRWTRFSRRIKKFGSRSGMISPLNFPLARKIGGNRAAIYLSKMKISKRCSIFSKRSSCCYSTRLHWPRQPHKVSVIFPRRKQQQDNPRPSSRWREKLKVLRTSRAVQRVNEQPGDDRGGASGGKEWTPFLSRPLRAIGATHPVLKFFTFPYDPLSLSLPLFPFPVSRLELKIYSSNPRNFFNIFTHAKRTLWKSVAALFAINS